MCDPHAFPRPSKAESMCKYKVNSTVRIYACRVYKQAVLYVHIDFLNFLSNVLWVITGTSSLRVPTTVRFESGRLTMRSALESGSTRSRALLERFRPLNIHPTVSWLPPGLRTQSLGSLTSQVVRNRTHICTTKNSTYLMHGITTLFCSLFLSKGSPCTR